MKHKHHIPKIQLEESAYVRASDVARLYGVTSRYILQLAAAGTIPSLRLGKKCVRFDLDAVALALEGED
ncbi:MAG: hypothetical protein H7A51_16105 [Akkermansiaceae bacterium]|nr:hypothetical protein [Akkermansiaceae bacterium]